VSRRLRTPASWSFELILIAKPVDARNEPDRHEPTTAPMPRVSLALMPLAASAQHEDAVEPLLFFDPCRREVLLADDLQITPIAGLPTSILSSRSMNTRSRPREQVTADARTEQPLFPS